MSQLVPAAVSESVAEVRGGLAYGEAKTHQRREVVLPGFVRDRLAASPAADHVS